MQNISSDQRDEKRVLHVVIKCIASSEAFDGTASQRPEPVGCFFVRRTEHLTEVLRQKLAQTLCCRCCNRLQKYSPRYPENLAYPTPSARTRSAPAALSKVARCGGRHRTENDSLCRLRKCPFWPFVTLNSQYWPFSPSTIGAML